MIIKEQAKDIKRTARHFWPATKNTKMSIDYENVGYTKGIDYHDKLNQDYFGFKLNADNHTYTKPNVPETALFETQSESDLELVITLNYKAYQEIYPDLNLKKVNYFASDFISINDKIALDDEDEQFTYWFVENSVNTYDQITGEIVRIKFYLKADVWSIFYNKIWNFNGVVNIKRLHNERFLADNLYNNGVYYIPDIQNNRFIRNCDDVCRNMNELIQVDKTQNLISSRHFSPTQNQKKDDPYSLTWKDKNVLLNETTTNEQGEVVYAGAEIATKKNMFLFWLTRSKQDEQFKGNTTSIEGYNLPTKLIIYVPNSNDGKSVAAEYQNICLLLTTGKIDGKGENVLPQELNTGGVMEDPTYYINAITLTENVFDNNTLKVFTDKSGNAFDTNKFGTLLVPIDNNLSYYQASQQELDAENNGEYFYFIDKDNYISNKLFVKPSDIVNMKYLPQTIEEVNKVFEPHCYMGQHFQSKIALFNKGGITFDLSTMLNNNISDKYSKIKFYPATIVDSKQTSWPTYRIMKRLGYISPENVSMSYFLLDNDTSLSYKRDNNVLTLKVQGSYAMPSYDNTYLDYVKQTAASRQAGIDNAHQQRQTTIGNSWIGAGSSTFGSILSGAVSGGIAGNLPGAAIGAVMGATGSALSSTFSVGSAFYNAKAQEEMSLRTINATYEDAKSKPANISYGENSTSQADLKFQLSFQDEMEFLREYGNIWTPKITFLELKPYDKITIQNYCNKYGYPQDYYTQIKSFDDFIKRKYWNNVSISNASEIAKQNNIPDYYIVELIQKFASNYGIRMWNLELDYDGFFDYTINNYESTLEGTLQELQGEVKGDSDGK